MRPAVRHAKMGLIIRANDNIQRRRSNVTINNGSEAVPVEKIEYDDEECSESRRGTRSSDGNNDSEGHILRNNDDIYGCNSCTNGYSQPHCNVAPCVCGSKGDDVSKEEGCAFDIGGESRILDGGDDEGNDDIGQANESSVVSPPDDEVAAAAVIPALDREAVAQGDDEADSGSSSDDDGASDRGACILGGSGEIWKLGNIARLDQVRVLRGGAQIVCGETWPDKTWVLRGGARIFGGYVRLGGEA